MSYFVINGTRVDFIDGDIENIAPALPVGNYVVEKDPRTLELFLSRVDSFTPPKKIYGDVTKTAERMINTFMSRGGSTGVMLTGEKGSGKTLLAKMLSYECAKQDIPTILISQPWHDEQFKQLIQSIKSPCVVIFDEFEKVFNKENQEDILTLLDGVFPSKKLFVLTCNDKAKTDSHLRNRPGRIFYLIDFEGIDEPFIVEYCEDNLINKDHMAELVDTAALFDIFNFDMLHSIVEEMNRYGEPAPTAMKMLNAKPEYGEDQSYDVTVFVDTKQLIGSAYWPQRWKGNPLLMNEMNLNIYTQKKNKHIPKVVTGDPYADEDGCTVDISSEDLQRIDQVNKIFTFKKTGTNVTIVLERVKKVQYNIKEMLLNELR